MQKNNILVFLMVMVLILIVTPFLCTSAYAPMPENTEATETTTTAPTEAVEEVTSPAVLDLIELNYDMPTHVSEANVILDGIVIRLTLAENTLENLLQMGYSAEHPAVLFIQLEIQRCNDLLNYYEPIQAELYIEANWERRMEEYPVASQIWLYMKNELGWNDYVCAGVMGNMMAESGGQTFNIDPYNWDDATGNTYYGICQWNAREGSCYYKYSPNNEVKNINLEDQLQLLTNSVEKEFNTYGHIYQQGFNYKSFIDLKDCREAALIFAKVYERCGSGSYQIRQDNAEKAYEYFKD